MKNKSMKSRVALDGSPDANAAPDDRQRAGLPRRTQVEFPVVSVADALVPPSGSWAATPIIESADSRSSPQAAGMVTLSRQAHDKAMQAVDDMQARAGEGRERLCALFPDWAARSEVSADSAAWRVLKEDERQPNSTVVGANSPCLPELMFDGGAQKSGAKVNGSVARAWSTPGDAARANAQCANAQCASSAPASTPVRLIVGIDGSPDAQSALDVVRARSFLPGREVRVVVVLDPRMAIGIAMLFPALARWVGDGGRNADAGSDAEDEFAWVSEMVEAAVAQLRDSGLAARGAVRKGDSKRVRLDEAESWKADRIFIGAKGLPGSSGLQNLEQFFVGSMATVVASPLAATTSEFDRTLA